MLIKVLFSLRRSCGLLFPAFGFDTLGISEFSFESLRRSWCGPVGSLLVFPFAVFHAILTRELCLVRC